MSNAPISTNQKPETMLKLKLILAAIVLKCQSSKCGNFEGHMYFISQRHIIILGKIDESLYQDMILNLGLLRLVKFIYKQNIQS